VALLASIAAHGGFVLASGGKRNPIPVIFGTCFNHATIARLEAGGMEATLAPVFAQVDIRKNVFRTGRCDTFSLFLSRNSK
jgi:hypothetical protein